MSNQQMNSLRIQLSNFYKSKAKEAQVRFVFSCFGIAGRFSGHCSGGCKSLIRLFHSFSFVLPYSGVSIVKLFFHSFILAFKFYILIVERGGGVPQFFIVCILSVFFFSLSFSCAIEQHFL